MGRDLVQCGGLISQMTLQAARGLDIAPTRRLLERPDPDILI